MTLTAVILRIERISLNDGRGMRTVVFFKGCPLRCAWCSTPESQNGRPEVYYRQERCRLCGACVAACPEQALRQADDGSRLLRDPARCRGCFRCVEVCNYRAHLIYGRKMTVEQVMREIRKDEIFFFHSGGGVTLSGGDLLCQTDFAEALLRECIDSGIDTCAELDLYAVPSLVRRIVPLLDSCYADLKCLDTAVHKQWTGADNDLILANLRLTDRLCRPGRLTVRVPVVAGINDGADNIRRTAEFCDSLHNCGELEFLPYHRLGLHAYRQLQRPYLLEDRPPLNRWDVYQRMGFLCDQPHHYAISISGLPVYEPASGKLPVTKEELQA
ncbi:MAG: glycyl-radical enzyme activating protein [Firmicutes bacterium]|nr:glycyl-radical enzyme activating protein [Bacillota bacterium]